MEVESLAALKGAFETWRRGKHHPREAIPATLIERAYAAARHHGSSAVARATKVDRGRLEARWSDRDARDNGAAAASVPAYSRLEMAALTTRPFAEVETPTGLKVRLFAETGEALGLLSALLGAGGAR